MKAVKITLLIVILLTVLNFIIEGEYFHPAKTLPFVEGNNGLYGWAALVLIVIFFWGLSRLNRNDKDE